MCAGVDDSLPECHAPMAYGLRDGLSGPSNGMNTLPVPGMSDTGQPGCVHTMTEAGSFPDVPHLHLLWHQGKARHVLQLEELAPELAGSKFMQGGTMVSSMPVIVEIAFESPLIVSVVQLTLYVIRVDLYRYLCASFLVLGLTSPQCKM